MTCGHTPTDKMGRLRFPAFLLVLLYTTVVQITEELIHVSKFPEAADYSFYNCRKEMLQMVTKAGGLLQTELNNNTEFMKMWNSTSCKKAIPEGTPEHMTALQSYVEANPKFHKTFNKLVHTKSRSNSTYQDMFPFKSLFFLLTDAMQLLKSNCNTVYSATGEKYSFNIEDKVRFESFLPANLEYSAATEDAAIFETIGTVFNISSCSVINLDKVCISEDIDLLISPTEVFTVKDIKTVSNSNDNYIEINLMHSHMYSSSNCSSLVSVSEESKESSSSFLSSSSLSLMASLLMMYFYMQTL